MGETVMNGLMDDLRQRGMKVEGQVKGFSSFDSDVETAGMMKLPQLFSDTSATEKWDNLDEPIQCP